jgi:hypothetical protein
MATEREVCKLITYNLGPEDVTVTANTLCSVNLSALLSSWKKASIVCFDPSTDMRQPSEKPLQQTSRDTYMKSELQAVFF